MAVSASFDWPPMYYFPPMFTMQVNKETRIKQIQLWTTIIHKYCREKKIFILDTANNDASIFSNTEIDRKLTVNAIQDIVDFMCTKGHAEWINSRKDRFFVFWNSREKWAEMLLQYATDNGLRQGVATLYELMTSNAEFAGMDQAMLIRCLKCLEESSKAEIMGDEGVKFF